MDVPVGRAVYTPLLTPRGGFRSDLTIMRLGDELFRVVTGGAHGCSDRKWFADHLPADGSAQLHDQTSAWCTLGLWGPRARDILAATTSDDVSHEGFPFARARTIEIGSLRVLASRISYVGDLGWELYVPIEQGARLWDAIAEAGAPHGIVPAGIGVYGTTGRLEKCYRAYGFELDGEYNVVEAGMAGRERQGRGLRRPRGAPAPPRRGARRDPLHADRRRPHLRRAACSRYMLGGEPILTRDGEPLVDAPRPALVRHQRRRRARRSASTS